jgi:hypothetical protein
VGNWVGSLHLDLTCLSHRKVSLAPRSKWSSISEADEDRTFFEIFSSLAAHKCHLEQDYMKRLFTALEGKLAGATIVTKLNAL